MLFLVGEDVFKHAPRRRVLVADEGDHLALGFDGDALGHQVGAHHGLDLGGIVVGSLAALKQPRGAEVGLATELHDALGNAIGVSEFGNAGAKPLAASACG